MFYIKLKVSEPCQIVYVSQGKLIREKSSTVCPNPINRIVNLGQSLESMLSPC